MVFGSDWTAGTAALEFRGLTSIAMQIARCFTICSAAKIFGVVVSLIAAAGVTYSARCCYCGIPLASEATRRSSTPPPRPREPKRSRGRHDLPRPPPLLNDSRKIVTDLKNDGGESLTAHGMPQRGEITTRAVGCWMPRTRTLVSRACAYGILKLRCVAFQRASSELHRTPLSAIAEERPSYPVKRLNMAPWQFTGG